MKTLQVVYADDDEDIRELLTLSLEFAGGFEIRTATNGRAALSAAIDRTPDLVILDVMMPGLDGPAVLSELRGIDHLAKIPVIFFTAKAQAEETERLLALGAAGVIGKPFDPITVADEIMAIWTGFHGR